MHLFLNLYIFTRLLTEAPETLVPPIPNQFTNATYFQKASNLYKVCGNWATNEDGSHDCFRS